jgi:pyruvate formate lyase activating enzyme
MGFKKWVVFLLCLGAIMAIWLFTHKKGTCPVFVGAATPQAVTSATPEIKQTSRGETLFFEKLENRTVRCGMCFKGCVIPEGKRGFCRNRENKAGILYNIVFAKPSAIHIDPIEKEPSFHMLPGTKILCFGTAGCNFRCKFCQNWHLSQRSIEEMEHVQDITPERAVQIALERKIPTLSFTYNEPTSFYEYVYETARLAKQKGLRILWHSNGSMSPAALRELLKYTDAVTIDLKGFTDTFYKEASAAKLQPVLETLKIIKNEGVWLEIVNLVIPGLNDNPQDIRRMCEWIKDNLGPDTPLHFSRFFPAYKLMAVVATPIETLEQAHTIAKEAGLNFVTIGNVPGHERNSTFCPRCGYRLIHRVQFAVLSNHIKKGKCGFCAKEIPGIWNE